MFRYNRNTNYLGEMLIYTSFAILTEKNISFVIILFIWSTIFTINIICKDNSLKKKLNWLDYYNKSGIIYFKLFKN